MSLYLRLFLEFFKTGLFAVGGGMATLPFMYDISDKTGWFTHSMLADMVAVSESTPGPIGVNMATYVGFVTGGIPGAVGLIAAAGVLVIKLALFNTELYASTGALLDLFNFKALILAAVLLAATRCIKKLKGLHPIVFILASAVIGIVFSF